MQKKRIVLFTGRERKICDDTTDKLKGSSRKPRRGKIPRPLDAGGPNWTDQQVAEAVRCRGRTVENVGRRRVMEEVRSIVNCIAGRLSAVESAPEPVAVSHTSGPCSWAVDTIHMGIGRPGPLVA